LNFNRERMKHTAGFRELILTRNKFGDGFARGLMKILINDKYLKVIDLAGNRISKLGLEIMMKLALVEHNETITAFDVRMNTGCTERIMERYALCMIRNIDLAKKRGHAL
jgi:Ran GTPase-activating protein (RanGAP) involved in mRNA processing and transport